MIEEQAVVIALENKLSAIHPSVSHSTDYDVNSTKHEFAILEIMRHVPCGICGQTRGCGNSIWGKIFAHKSSTFKVINSINAKVGDAVIIGIDEKLVLKSALLLYALPLLTMMIGALLSQLVQSDTATQKDLYAIIGAVLGLFLGFIWLKGHTTSQRYTIKNQPVILRLAHFLDVRL